MCAVNMDISDYRRALKACGPGCHFSSKAGKKVSIIWPNQFPTTPALMQWVPVPKLLVAIPPLLVHEHVSAESMPTSTTYAALKNCLMFASKPPLAYLCVCYCLSWIELRCGTFQTFSKLTCEHFKCAKIILTYICNIYSLVQHEIGRVDLLQNVN